MASPDFQLGSASSLSPGVKFVLNHFFDDSHYTALHSSSQVQWNISHSLQAALKLMEEYGITMTPEEQQQLQGMGTEQMIEALITRMPQQSKEDFQKFFLQLQLIVATATQLRDALEQGAPEQVTEVLNGADSAGVTPYILKMAIAQTGAEVANLKKQHAAWVTDADQKMQTLISGQADATQAQKQLKAAQEKLAGYMSSHNDKAKKMVMGLAGGQGKALLVACFSGWASETRRMKNENEIRKEYAERIDMSEKRLAEYIATQMEKVTGVINRKFASMESGLLSLCFDVFKSDVEEKKRDAEALEQVKAVEAKLRAYADSAAENAKKVMARVGAGSDSALLSMCVQAWVNFLNEYKKNKDMEDQVRAAEARVAQFMKSKADNAKGVLDRMSGASNTGLLHSVVQAWTQIVAEEKQGKALEDALSGGSGKLGLFGKKNKQSAQDLMRKASAETEKCVLMKCFLPWKMEVKVEKMALMYGNVMEGKKAQLSQVQGLFRDFAKKLEAGLKDGTPRDQALMKKKSMSKTGNSVSLPDIHSPQPGASQRSGQRSGSRGSGRRA